jgi:hypothetical protein
MPDPTQPTTPSGQAPASEPARSFASGEEDGYRTDTFSRNDREGLPSEVELTGREASSADVNRALDAGEEGAYRTDTFSRNDGEGLPVDEEPIDQVTAGSAPAARNPLKATDDPDSRDATPPSAQGGGVR